MNARMFKAFVKEAMALQADNDTPGDYTATLAATQARFPGLEKRAWASGELAGLGILAAPSVMSLAGHPMEERNKDLSEVAGLGILAAPYAHQILARRIPRYAASGIGQKLTNVFGHV